MFFRSNPKKIAEKASREKGHRLRRLCKTYDNQAMIGEAMEIVEQYGFDPLVINCAGNGDYTPIYYAVMHDLHELAVKIATTTAFDDTALNAMNETILLTALQRQGNSQLIQELLQHTNINVSLKNAWGNYALRAASLRTEYYTFLQTIIERTDPAVAFDYCQSQGHYHSPLHEMVMTYIKQDSSIDKDLLLTSITNLVNLPFSLDKKKFKIRQQAIDYALLNAATNGSEALVRLLLNAGANTEHTCREGQNAYQLAKYHGHREIAMIIANRFSQAPSAPPAEINIPPHSAPVPEASAPPLSAFADGPH